MTASNTVVDLAKWRPTNKSSLLTELFNENQRALSSFLRVRLGQSEDAQDLLQEVFLRLARSPDLVEKMEACDNPRAYLFSIVNNLIVDRHRRNAVRDDYERSLQHEGSDVNSWDTPERDLVVRRDLERAKAVIMGLPPKCQKAFVLSRFQQMSYRQIAESMDVPIKRVEKYIGKALAALRENKASKTPGEKRGAV